MTDAGGDSSTKSRAVVLLSGGIDSSTTLAIARASGHELFAMSFNYRQRHSIELDSARKVAESMGVARHLVISFDLREIGGSALTSEVEVPKDRLGTITGGQDAGTHTPRQSDIPITYVPARNTIFLSFALGWAEVIGADDIYIGATAVDYSGYPDCRPEYFRAFEAMANLATRVSAEGERRFRICAPLIHLKKSEIIRKGLALGVDYSLTWSCYDPQPFGEGSNFRPCWACDSCRFRQKGFEEAGLEDPLYGVYHTE